MTWFGSTRCAAARRSPTSGGSAYCAIPTHAGLEKVHIALTAGSIIRVRGPRNHFPAGRERRYLFIAGGIGITPMLPMIAEANAAGSDWRLLYGGRERASMAFPRRTSPSTASG